MIKTIQIIITGSSGYVGAYFCNLLKNYYENIKFIDLCKSANANRPFNISNTKIIELLKIDKNVETIVINLAAARSDFGLSAKEYYDLNYEDHRNFLETLNNINVIKFIHISSVAAIDGSKISYSSSLNCDDSYRSTKYLQGELIKDWCKNKNINNINLFPSAIFSDEERSDTNIGKLQIVINKIPILPRIKTKKSLTYLPHFCDFILKSIQGDINNGDYLTIDGPTLGLDTIISTLNPKSMQIWIPGLNYILLFISFVLYVLGGFGRFDLKLTPNRVKKVFSETSYSKNLPSNLNTTSYNLQGYKSLYNILSSLQKN